MPGNDSLQKLLAQGRAANNRNERDEAWRCFKELAKRADELGEQSICATAHREIASLLIERGDLDGAFRHCRTAIEIAESLWSRYDMAEGYHLLGVLLCEGEDQESGIRYLRKTLPLWDELADKTGEARSRMQIGIALYAQGDHKGAIKNLSLAIPRFNTLGEMAMVAALHRRIGAAFTDLNEPEEAITHTLAALGRHRHLKDEAHTRADLRALLVLKTEVGEPSFSIVLKKFLDEEGMNVVQAMMAKMEDVPSQPAKAAESVPEPGGLAPSSNEIAQQEAELENTFFGTQEAREETEPLLDGLTPDHQRAMDITDTLNRITIALVGLFALLSLITIVKWLVA